MMLQKSLIFFCILLLIPLASAMTISNSTLESSGVGIYINGTLEARQIDVNATNIYLFNITNNVHFQSNGTKRIYFYEVDTMRIYNSTYSAMCINNCSFVLLANTELFTEFNFGVPVLANVTTPTNTEIGQTVSFSADCSDTVGINNVTLNIRYGGTTTSAAMVNTTATRYVYNYSVGAIGDYESQLICTNTLGTSNTTAWIPFNSFSTNDVSVEGKLACKDIFGTIQDSFGLGSIGIFLIVAVLLFGIIAAFNSEAIDLQTFLATLTMVILFSLLFLIGFYIVAKVNGAIC